MLSFILIFLALLNSPEKILLLLLVYSERENGVMIKALDGEFKNLES